MGQSQTDGNIFLRIGGIVEKLFITSSSFHFFNKIKPFAVFCLYLYDSFRRIQFFSKNVLQYLLGVHYVFLLWDK